MRLSSAHCRRLVGPRKRAMIAQGLVEQSTKIPPHGSALGFGDCCGFSACFPMPEKSSDIVRPNPLGTV
jgi:hypothetical protein